MRKEFLLSLLLSLASSFLIAQQINQYNAQNQRQGYWVFYHDPPKNELVKLMGNFENGKEIDTFKYYIPKIEHPMSVRIYDDLGHCYAFFYNKSNQLIAEGQYDKSHKKHGKWCYYDQEQNLSSIEQFAHGAKDKTTFVFFDNGKIVEYQTYRKGIKHGIYERFNDKNLQLETINFFENHRHGEAFFYDLEGNISISGYYNHGIKDKIWTYYKAGQIERTEDYTPAGRKRKKMQTRRLRKEREAKKQSSENMTDTVSATDWIKELNSKGNN